MEDPGGEEVAPIPAPRPAAGRESGARAGAKCGDRSARFRNGGTPGSYRWRRTATTPADAEHDRRGSTACLGSGPRPAGRVYLTWNLGERHGLRALAAPFSLTETGAPDAPIDFEGERFAAGVPIEATYTFNSYRLTYRYRVRATERSMAWVGFTAKVRDATIALEQGATASRKDNVGFVPLLHLAGDLRATPRWRVSFDADALAGGPGRAIDTALKVGYDLRDDLTVQAGYRTLEGGADVEETYNFTWLHYAVASIVWRR